MNNEALLADWNSLSTAEQRLEWLVERPTDSIISEANISDELLIRECVSKLWLEASILDGRCQFRCRSQSQVVQGVVAFLCDFYNGLTAREIIELDKKSITTLGIEALLGITRKMAVARVVNRIEEFAKTTPQ